MRPRFVTLAALISLNAFGAEPAITPRPAVVVDGKGALRLSRECFVTADPGVSMNPILETLNAPGRVKFSAAKSGGRATVVFRHRVAAMGASPEAYWLSVTRDGITVTGDHGGLYYGAQTLARLLENAHDGEADGAVSVGEVAIEDAPRFAWRGYMLDESRHFSGEAAVKRTLDAMARYKLNRFHWHLTDSAGWRIEIQKYPRLAVVGGKGDETLPSDKALARYYTQAQIRDIVAYAAARHITVIPEIDMPGHADAAVRAYPQHDGGGYLQRGSDRKWPHFTFNPGKPETREFLNGILGEVATLFPDAKVIHFGGDEVHFGWKQWPEFPEVQALMKREMLKDNAAVEAWFNRKTAEKIRSLGFLAGGWDEIVATGIPPKDALVFWWRHDKPQVLNAALDNGYPVVLCPRIPCYFDFIQSGSHKSGRVWDKDFNPLARVYAFPSNLGLTPTREARVAGIQACLWTEATRTQARRDFLTWPRLVALAESAWTTEPRKDFHDFSRRLSGELPRLRARGFTVHDPFADSAEVTDPKASDASEYLDNPE